MEGVHRQRTPTAREYTHGRPPRGAPLRVRGSKVTKTSSSTRICAARRLLLLASMNAHSLFRPLDDAPDEAPVTARPSFDLAKLARSTEEVTVVIPAALLLALLQQSAMVAGQVSQADIVELDPDNLIDTEGALEMGAPRSAAPASPLLDDDAIDVLLDDLVAPAVA